jgi:hypothetical protein
MPVSIFVERFVLPVLAAIPIGVIVLNPLKLDLRQRVSLCVVVVSLAYFVGHTLNKPKSESIEVQSKPSTAESHPATGSATTMGDKSPAVTGNGNTVEYNSSESGDEKAKDKRRGKQ